MNKNWLKQLACDVEAKHGKEKRDLIFGNIDDLQDNPKFLSAWFENLTTEMDNLDDKEFLQKMMAERSPCRGDDAGNGKIIKDLHEKSGSLAEFVDNFRDYFTKKFGEIDKLELRGDVLYMIKPLGGSTDTGSSGKGCHCWLAKHANRAVSDIFCHCCTIGHTGGMFVAAFGDDVRLEHVESIISGGKECTMAVHLPKTKSPGI